MRYYGTQNEVKAYLNRLQNETSIQVTPSIVKTLNDRVESLKKSGVWSQYSLGFNDTDADSYFQRASVNDVIGRSEVCWFVRGMKSLGLWQNMVSWPLRSYQNAGTGSTVFSLGGLGVFNAVLVNSPTWNISGISATTSTQSISTNRIPTQEMTISVVKSVGSLPLSTNWSRNMFTGGTINETTGMTHDANFVFDHPQVTNRLSVTSPAVSLNVPFMLLATARFTGSQIYFNSGSVGSNSNSPAVPITTRGFNIFASLAGTVSHNMIFASMLNKSVTTSEVSMIYNLHKSTLVSNLGLP